MVHLSYAFNVAHKVNKFSGGRYEFFLSLYIARLFKNYLLINNPFEHGVVMGIDKHSPKYLQSYPECLGTLLIKKIIFFFSDYLFYLFKSCLTVLNLNSSYVD